MSAQETTLPAGRHDRAARTQRPRQPLPRTVTAPEPERRLTPTERLHEVTMAALHRTPAAPESSFTLSRNAKGIAQFEIVIRDTDPFTAETLACEAFDRLTERYPYPSTNGGTE